jgi:hypothetical protein
MSSENLETSYRILKSEIQSNVQYHEQTHYMLLISNIDDLTANYYIDAYGFYAYQEPISDKATLHEMALYIMVDNLNQKEEQTFAEKMFCELTESEEPRKKMVLNAMHRTIISLYDIATSGSEDLKSFLTAPTAHKKQHKPE